jgi:aminopeptidase N
MKFTQRLHARCACAGAAAPFTLAGTERQYERSRPFTISHLLLDVVLDFARASLDGVATLDYERKDADATELELDAVGMSLAEVALAENGAFRAIAYEYDGDKIRILVPKQSRSGKVRIAYRATPRRGLYFLAPDRFVKDRPVQVWSQCQDEDARHWFPCHDKPHVKMTTELSIAVPAGFTALSNGELVRSECPRQGKKPWRYWFKMDLPHPSYLVTLVAGRFSVLEDRDAERGRGQPKIPVRYYVPKGRETDGQRSFGETPRMIELFGKLTGVPYPWSRYSQVVVSDFIFGGMENTTATTMYEHILLDKRAALDVSSNDLVAHELAHQWFGDYVTCRDWSHAWLNEGFATFFEHLEREDRLGKDEYEYGILTDVDSYLAEANGRYQRPIVCRDYDLPIDLFDRHLYEKGGLVLHMLRRELGDETFWRGVKTYLVRHAGGVVETNDLMRALEEVSGRSLERFFDQWVYRQGHPQLKLKIGWDDGLLSVSVKQAQRTGATAVFAFELEIAVAGKDGRVERHVKSVTEANDTMVVALAERPKWVAFDPDLRVIGDVTVEAPSDMLRQQLEHGTSARIKGAAAQALAKRDDPPTIAALGKALKSSREAWMVRVEAAQALGRIRGDESLRELEKNTSTAHPKVRRAVMSALGGFRVQKAARLLSPKAKRDQSYLVQAEACRALGRTRQSGALEVLLPALDVKAWGDVIRAGALDGLAALRSDAAIPKLIERTRYGVPTRGRRAAIAGLARLSDSRRVREHLEDLLDDKDPHLRAEVVGALHTLADPRARSALRRHLEHELDGRVARRIREVLRDLGETASGERSRINDDLEALRSELTELKTRLSKLEMKKKSRKEQAPKRSARARRKAPASK